VSIAHLYVHAPFCARRCSYCDFAIAVRRRVPVEEFLGTLAREAAHHRAETPAHTLYVGGGTPSRLGGEGLARLLRLFGAERGIEECTIEANPEDVTPEAAAAWVRAGVNRLSIGAQSFDGRVLAWMHRTHDVEAIGRAVRTARDAGIRNLSLDLIFALPESLTRDWHRDLAEAVALGPEHISLYGLTVEPHTPLRRWIVRGDWAEAPGARYADEYLLAHEVLAAAGYLFYEVSNAAKPGREARHNAAYWAGAPYLGLGPSAHSFDGTDRWWNEPVYVRWRAKVAERGGAVTGRETLTAEQRRLEHLYLGLRTRSGVPLSDGPQTLAPKAALWERAGWAELVHAEGGVRLRLTPTGWLRLDELVASV
jgi:oxygen-independent coproporphyrinogen-3 oxidase